MLKFFKKGLASLLMMGATSSAFALEMTITFDRIPDEYKPIFDNTYYRPKYIFGKVVVETGNDVNYDKTKQYLWIPRDYGYISIKNLPFISYYDITYGASNRYLTKTRLDPFLLELANKNEYQHETITVKQITLTYGVNFVWNNYRYSLLTDETAQVERGANSSELVVPSTLGFAKEGFYDVTVTTVYGKAFANLSKLTKITLPATITSIGSGAFSNSPNLTTVVMQATTPPTLSADAFDASAVQNVAVYVPAEAYSLYKSAPVWKDMNIIPSGDSVAIDGINYNVTSDGIALVTSFDNDIETVAIPSTVSVDGTDCKVAIGLLPAQTANNLKSIYIGEDVAIQALSNKSVPNLKKIFYLGTSAPAITPGAMTSFANEDVQVYGASNEAISGIIEQTGGTPRIYPMLKNRFTTDGVVYIPTSTAGRTCDAVDYDYTTTNPAMGASATYRNVAFTIENINPYIFHQANALNSLSIDNTLPIPANFAKQTSVTTIELTSGEIAAEALMGNASLTELTLNNTGNIGTSAFANSANLTRLTINSKGNMGESAFANSATALISCGAEIEINNAGVIERSAFEAFGPIAYLYIGENVTGIKESAFENAFSGDINGFVEIECTGAIGTKAFYNTHNITTLTIAESVTGIGAEAFSFAMTGNKATALLYNSGTIAENSFSNNAAMTEVEIGENCRAIGTEAFSNNNALTEVTVGDGCTAIADRAFANNIALTSVTLGDAIESLGNEVFKGNAALKNVTFGSGLKTLGDYVFDNCTSMETLTVRAIEPPVCGTYDFRHIDTWSCELLVKRSSINAYAVAPQWNEFMNLSAFFDPNEVTDIVVDPESGLDDIFTNDLNIFVNDSKQVLVKVEPATAIAELKWESSDDAVATVDNNGTVVGVGVGEAKITITADDFSRAFTVKVNKREQTILWNQDFANITEGESVELTATTTSGLDVEYLIVTGEASVAESTLTVNGPGKITIEAGQPGNDEYLAAEAIQKSLNAVSGADISMADGSLFRIDGQELVVLSGAFELFNLQGVLIKSGTAPTRIALTPHATYILRINNKNIKLMMK